MDFRNIIKKMREIDPTTPGQDLEHFTQLAESTGIALGAKEVVTEAKKDSKVKEAAKPDFLDMDKDGDKKEPMKKAAKDAKKKKEPVKEAEKTKYSLDDLKKQRDKLASRTKELEKLGKDDKKKNESVELVDDFGEIVEAKKSAAQKKAQEKFKAMVKGKKGDDKDSMDESSAKPDYIDIDKDGDKKEPMKKAAKDAKKGKKKTVKESVEPKMSFVEMMKLVRESGGQQAIDPMDDVLWNWANRVATSKVEETNKQEIFAAMLYERNGGRFEMYDVVEKGLNEGKDCNCGPDCECKGNCGDDCNCGPNC